LLPQDPHGFLPPAQDDLHGGLGSGMLGRQELRRNESIVANDWKDLVSWD
jgi:hypothetical protein